LDGERLAISVFRQKIGYISPQKQLLITNRNWHMLFSNETNIIDLG